MPVEAVERYAPRFAQTFARRREDRPVLAGGHLHVLDVVAPVDRRAVVLAARLGPLDRAAAHLRGEDDHRVFRVVGDLAAEAAADFRRDDADLVLGDPRVEREQEAHDVRVLRGHPEGDLVGRGRVLRQRRPRLDGVGDQALVDDPLLDDHVGGAEGGVRVAPFDVPLEADVVRNVRVELGLALLRRLLGVGDVGQGVVVHFDRVGGVLRAT